MSLVYAILDQNRCDANLSVSMGGLVVSTLNPGTYRSAVFGSLALGSGHVGFECQFWSNSQPAAGLVNMCTVGIATPDTPTNKYIGELSTSYGLNICDTAAVAGGTPGAGGIYNNAGRAVATPLLVERRVISVLLYNDPTTPIVSWMVDGNFLGQMALPVGKTWVPAVSLGSATAGDISAYLNFGQRRLTFPTMQVNL